MRLLVLGAGLMAHGAVACLLRTADVASITVADLSQRALDSLVERFDDARIKPVRVDAGDSDAVDALMGPATGVISAIHYGLNEALTRSAIESGTHMVDLGGNNDVVRAQLALDPQARAAGISVIPDCGVAPGLVSVLVAWGMARFDWVDSVQIRVGGLPLVPKAPLMYERLFSVEGLINEYVEPPLMLRDGVEVVGEPLGDVEPVEFPPPVGMLEAFNTSGGVSTLTDTYRDRLRNLDYKTLRYPGHAQAMRWLFELGLFSSDQVEVDGVAVVPRHMVARAIERHIPQCERDRTVIRVEFRGSGEMGPRMHRIELVDEFDSVTGLTSMMRTTAFPAAITSVMQCRGQVAMPGVCPLERVIDPDAFVAEMRRWGFQINGVD